MGYSTEFQGRFTLNRPLDPETLVFLQKLAATRRMARNVGPEYGEEGEFFVDGERAVNLGELRTHFRRPKDPNIIDYNRPPRAQPSLWCCWVPTPDGTAIEWNGVEKADAYDKWLVYLIERVLKPRGYSLEGVVRYEGDDPDDFGTLSVHDNQLTITAGQHLSDRGQPIPRQPLAPNS